MLAEKKFPIILMISDIIPSKNRCGLSQTLYNLFDSYPKDNLIHLLIDNETVSPNAEILHGVILNMKMNYIYTLNNRVGVFVNTVISKINFFFRDTFGIFGTERLETYNIDYILVSTTLPEKLHYAYLLRQKLNCKLITYFMDNWADTLDLNWYTGNIHKLISDICKISKAMIYISEDLKNIFEKKYFISEKTSLVVHNTVDCSLDDIFTNAEKNSTSEEEKFIITYAGSIWPMHADAIVLVAAAVEKLYNKNIKIEFHLYCPLLHWESYFKKNFCKVIIYKGFLPYDSLKTILKNANLLLIGSSFKKEFKNFSYSSLQTKTTDYMVAGRPLLSVGPYKCTCNNFVEKWSCGYVFFDQDVDKMSDFIIQILDNKNDCLIKGNNSVDAVAKYYSKPIVQKKLYNFIRSLNF